jgi:quercetin dioxygenase-like cupin family protein
MKQLYPLLAVVLLFSCNRLSKNAVPLYVNESKAPMILPPVQDTVLQSGRRNIYLVGRRNLPGYYVERSVFPAGYNGMPHVHNSDIYVTIISGSARIAFGKVFDTTVVADLYGPGSFLVIPADKPHYEWFREECTLQVEGNGPQETYYITDSVRVN